MNKKLLFLLIMAVILVVIVLFRIEKTELMPYYPPQHKPIIQLEVEDDEPPEEPGNIDRGVCGIYGLDSAQSTKMMNISGCAMRNKVLLQICNLDFVEGYAWRQVWKCMETSEGNYDFSGIDYMISLAEQCDKSLSISFGVAEPGEPDYIINNPGVVTYSYVDSDTGELIERPVPWDPYLIERFNLFMENLGEHEVLCQECGGVYVPLKEHPALRNIRGGIPGVGHLRDRIEYNIADLPGYSRENLLNTVEEDLAAVTDNFPEKQTALPMWKIQDDGPSPESWEVVLDMVLERFDGINNPRVGFFMENLAASNDSRGFIGYPNIEFAAPLYLAQNSTHTEFQMLTSWTTPFKDPMKINGTQPADAMSYGWGTFHTQYFEVYGNDLLNVTFQPALRDWVDQHCEDVAVNEGEVSLE